MEYFAIGVLILIISLLFVLAGLAIALIILIATQKPQERPKRDEHYYRYHSSFVKQIMRF